MDIHDLARSIHAAKGMRVIGLGFWLNKKSEKTPEEKAAAKAFLTFFRSTLGIMLLFTAILFLLTGYTVSGAEGYGGDYKESRTGRMEDGRVRYVKNTLCYIDPETIGLPAGLPDGTHINLYFDENDAVVAGENADELTAVVEGRVLLTVACTVTMIVALLVFAFVARKTFAKPWVQWLQKIKKGNFYTS